MSYRFMFAVLACATVAGCQSTQDAATNSAFKTPDQDGFIRSDLDNNGSRISRRVKDSEGDGFAYSVGTRDGKGFAGYAAVLPSSRVQAQPTSGTATYDAQYNVTRITNIRLSGDTLFGNADAVRGDITLRANFDNNTLRGDTRTLTVRGELNDTDRRLAGNVTYRGVQGQLRGLVGGDEVVGAFHGNSETLIYSGGFLGDAR